MDFIFLKRVRCVECGREFLIENNQPREGPDDESRDWRQEVELSTGSVRPGFRFE